MNEQILNKYSLNLQDYDTLVTISGTMMEIKNTNEAKIITDDGVCIPIVLHPKIISSYAKQGITLEEGEDVDVLGSYIIVDEKVVILITRCVIYEQGSSSALVS